VSAKTKLPTMQRGHTESREYREHRAHLSKACTTESAKPLNSVKPLRGPPVRNTVSGRTRIWKGSFERVHRRSLSCHARMGLVGSRYFPIHHLHKPKKRPYLWRAVPLPNPFPFVACLSTHYYPCFFSSLFPFFLFTYLSSDGEIGDWLFGFFWLAFEIGLHERRS